MQRLSGLPEFCGQNSGSLNTKFQAKMSENFFSFRCTGNTPTTALLMVSPVNSQSFHPYTLNTLHYCIIIFLNVSLNVNFCIFWKGSYQLRNTTKKFLSKFQVITQSRYWKQLVKPKKEMPVNGNHMQKCHTNLQNDAPRTGCTMCGTNSSMASVLETWAFKSDYLFE